jgi:hypothetical protein
MIGTWPFRIGDVFRSELGKEEVTASKVKARGCAGRSPQSMSLGPSAVMITLPGWRSPWHSPSSGARRSIKVRMPVAMCSGRRPPENRDQPAPVSRNGSTSGGGAVL